MSEIKQVAIAIIYREEQFLMQLRDNIPSIIHPGCWALFGGHLEKGETPEKALVREIKEEIDFHIESFTKFKSYQDEGVIRHVYSFPLTVTMDKLTLREGWDFKMVKYSEIQQGYSYSNQANDIKPFAYPHQQILLDFCHQFF